MINIFEILSAFLITKGFSCVYEGNYQRATHIGYEEIIVHYLPNQPFGVVTFPKYFFRIESQWVHFNENYFNLFGSRSSIRFGTVYPLWLNNGEPLIMKNELDIERRTTSFINNFDTLIEDFFARYSDAHKINLELKTKILNPGETEKKRRDYLVASLLIAKLVNDPEFEILASTYSQVHTVFPGRDSEKEHTVLLKNIEQIRNFTPKQ